MLGRAFRVLDRSFFSFGAVDYELRARDVVVGNACSSGGLFQLFNQAITDPDAMWPNWDTNPAPFFNGDVNDNNFDTMTGTGAALPARLACDASGCRAAISGRF